MYGINLLDKTESSRINNLGLNQVDIDRDAKEKLDKRFKIRFAGVYDLLISEGSKLLNIQGMKDKLEEMASDFGGILWMENKLGKFISKANLQAHGISEREVYTYYSKLVIHNH